VPGDRSDDELARTATASASGPAPQLGDTLGRYRLERALGEGGMGVVHAAFDPDLERRVALKVLRTTEGTGEEARQRLLREARAMARLTHANVVTVHEVGTASGRDYVAMELIDGETLAEWLRSAPRQPGEILAAFVSAGRGLAAAHAAGLVHRDFKPHNVLRRRDGRICVTDFGLARGVEVEASLEATKRLQAGVATHGDHTPSSLSGLTATGSVLGTPAYMAPEQWSGGTVGPAADQFAFCVALWEALTGERPFRGATVEALKAEVQRGPAELDASKLPRRVRGALRRGLDPDPARRWPSMDALLGALDRTAGRPALALVGTGAVLVAGGIAFVALRGGGGSGPSCEPPARELASVWTAATGDALAAAGRGDARDAFARDANAWSEQRAAACSGAPDHRAAQIICLDGVLARFDAIHHALDHITGDVPADAVLEFLVDPKVCMTAAPPRFTVAPSPDTIAAFALAVDAARGEPLTHVEAKDAAALATKPGIDPCARGYALRAQLSLEEDVPRSKAIANDEITAAEACGDDRLRAEALLDDAPLQFEAPIIGPKGRAAIEKAKLAVDRVAQPDLIAEIDKYRADVLAFDKHYDEGIAAAQHAMAGYAARGRIHAQLRALTYELQVRFARAEVADMKAVAAAVEKWKPVARQHHFDKLVSRLEGAEADTMLFLGDVMGAHAEMLRLFHPEPHADVPTQRIDGTVVDTAGKPVAGAIVAAGAQVFVDSVGPTTFGDNTGSMRMTTTDASGSFVIPDAPMKGGVVAQLGLARGMAEIEPHAKLVLQPTRRIAGKVNLGSVPQPKVFVLIVPAEAYSRTHRFIAPLQADGSFEVLAVPKARLAVVVALWSMEQTSDVAFTPLPAGDDVTGLELSTPAGNGRALDVIARSSVAATLDGAQVFLLPGRHSFHKASELFHSRDPKRHEEPMGNMQSRFARPMVGEGGAQATLGKLRPGDLVAHFDDARSGEVTACVVGISGDLKDPVIARKVFAHADELELRCETAGPDDKAIVVEAPPQKRFD
jgi:hypothetical protein